ncbi:MAG: tRNA (adenosine(37)-N6)-threonylcarbamoyltransferase complex dimerization subunit type 1 TsaB [Desulfobacterium sp. 4572_20]|nr:MAG: tRNA (adenosine(37)-N6)-threonylcarbamoyltransferase complex dimerization subunit type 1 TsaB [Desulfobacterium sp. 4572_20]
MKDEIVSGEYILPSSPSHFIGLVPQNIDGLIVALGPGSFTGIRIGLSVAKGFSECLNIPITGIHTLVAMASQLPYLNEYICPLVTSRKGEVFTAIFKWSARGDLLRCKEDTCLKINDLSTIIENKTIFIGNDFSAQGPILKQQFEENQILAPANLLTNT